MEQMIKTLAEGQQKLQEQAAADRQLLLKTYEAAQEQQKTALEKIASAFTDARKKPAAPPSQLPKYQDGDDPTYFFTNFERVAQQAGWPDAEWAHYIAPLLSGSLQAAYQAANPTGNTPYDEVKKALLERLGLDAEAYRQKARAERLGPEDTPRALYYRITDHLERWLSPKENTKEAIMDMITLEQFIESLPIPMQKWIKQHPDVNVMEAVEMATAFHRSQPKTTGASPNKPSPKPGGIRGGRRPSLAARGGGRGLLKYVETSNINPTIVCYHCGEKGHIARICPSLDEKMEVDETTSAALLPADMSYLTRVQVNHLPLKALLDTGSPRSAVPTEAVQGRDYVPNKALAITCVHGDRKLYPLVRTVIECGGITQNIEAAVLPQLNGEAIIGTDHLGQEIELKRVREGKDWRALPFFEEEIAPTQGKTYKSKNQKRREQRAFLSQVEKIEWGIPPDDSFSQAQHKDPTLSRVVSQLQTQTFPTQGPYFREEKGLLYRIVQDQEGEKRQLLVPHTFREHVMQMAHTHPVGGHLGAQKTTDSILRRFFWPGVYQQVINFCKQCIPCQLCSTTPIPKAPLHPLPIIQVPFEQVGIDIVGPLEKTVRGHTHILVLVDYASRYPEAFPMRSITTKAIADALIPFFARVGFPKTILTDQGPQFMSQAMKDLEKLLGITPLRTSIYHPQTDGLVERFNKTLKQMIHKTVAEDGRNWDKLLPWLLFAVRNTPQDSLKVSPFELIYGRQPRDVLDVQKEEWEQERPEDSPKETYVQNLKGKLERIQKIAHGNLKQAQEKQKKHYDKNAQLRTFQPGDKVLVLLPSLSNKMLTRWRGPYTVLERMGDVNYRLKQEGRRKPEQIYHVNLIKAWNQREDKEVLDPDDNLMAVLQEEENSSQKELPTIPDQLSDEQKKDLKMYVEEYSSFFSRMPGFVTLVQHSIQTPPGVVIRCRPYRLPERKRAIIQAEVEDMLQLDVIEESQGAWNSPIVLVPKPDGSTRFCIDFRRLNDVSQFDAYPMPRIDDLIENLGDAKYITTLDLTKGYWQIPLRKEDKEKTAFTTPQGLFQFKRMPFGLHGAPATFQRLMDKVLRPYTKIAGAYLDDIVIYSKTWEEHIQDLRTVSRALQQAGLTANPKKCFLAQQSTQYLGYVVGGGLILPQEKKIEAVSQMPFPKTRKEVRSFLGFIGYYRRFVPNFSTIAAPLTEMLKKQYPQKIRPSDEAVAAFQELKRILCAKPVLHTPNFEEAFILQTDASGVGLGAVLSQEVKNEERPVLFISRKLFPREVKYSTVEKECLAVKWAIEALKYYLLGRKFTLVTDHAPLTWMARNKDSNPRVLRWFLSLQPYCFSVLHRKGSLHINADFLSRYPSQIATGDQESGVEVCEGWDREFPQWHDKIQAETHVLPNSEAATETQRYLPTEWWDPVPAAKTLKVDPEALPQRDTRNFTARRQRQQQQVAGFSTRQQQRVAVSPAQNPNTLSPKQDPQTVAFPGYNVDNIGQEGAWLQKRGRPGMRVCSNDPIQSSKGRGVQRDAGEQGSEKEEGVGEIRRTEKQRREKGEQRESWRRGVKRQSDNPRSDPVFTSPGANQRYRHQPAGDRSTVGIGRVGYGRNFLDAELPPLQTKSTLMRFAWNDTETQRNRRKTEWERVE